MQEKTHRIVYTIGDLVKSQTIFL